jgi:hypothetical protein
MKKQTKLTSLEPNIEGGCMMEELVDVQQACFGYMTGTRKRKSLWRTGNMCCNLHMPRLANK